MKIQLLLLLIAPFHLLAQENKLNHTFSIYSGDYLGMKLPGNIPQKFAPDFISVHHETNQCLTFSPDGNHFVYVWADSTWSNYGMVYSRRINNHWLTKTLLKYKGSEQVPFNPTFSKDSRKIIFSMISSSWPNTDIYTLALSDSGYSAVPVRMPTPVNTDGLDFDYFIDSDSTVYFTGRRDDFVGGTFDLYSMKKNKNETVTTNLKILNSSLDDAAPYVSPDGTYMVFEKMVNDNNLSYNDSTARIIRIELFVTFRNKNKEWSAPVNLGPLINSKKYRNFRPVLSGDGKFLFYTQRNDKGSDIYWVSTHVIEKLRP